MTEPAKKRAVYEDLYTIPENTTGEIINGTLIVTPRPSRHHISTTSRLGAEIIPPYDFGRGGGPGGWVILDDPEILFGEDILVPDLAGWREERYPNEEPHNWISAAPDWVCEVLSPGTIRRDRITKMNIYALHEVLYFWLIDPLEKTLEVFRLKNGEWVVAGLYEGDDKVRAVPFIEIEIHLSDLWREPRRA